MEVSQAAELVKLRVVWWFEHFGKGSHEAVDSLLLNLKELCVEHKKSKTPKLADWIPPDVGSLKFNIDGSVKVKLGSSGIGGVLRDSNGKVLCLFSFHLGILDSNTVELCAIKKAMELIAANSNLNDRDIMVVSDSKVAVSWVNNGDFGNVSQVNDIYDIRQYMNSAGNIKVVFDSRIFNSFANSLAKLGANLDVDFIVWGDF